MAIENQFWGAPRIHGGLLKLGIVVSERTVSRYLPTDGGRRRRAGVHMGRSASGLSCRSITSEACESAYSSLP
jgi:hypothetical protein